MPDSPDRVLLLVAPTEYDASVAKGVDKLLHDFNEQGYFSKVVMVFPFTRHNRVVELAPNLVIHELAVLGPAALANKSFYRQAMAPLHLARVVGAIFRLARHEKVAAIRATDPCLSGFVALLGARLAGKPICVSIHADFDKRHQLDAAGGAPRVFGSRRVAIGIESSVLSRADMVLPIRESLIDYAARRGATAQRIHVIPHGADLSAFTMPAAPDALAGLGLPAGRRIISFAGRLSRENYVDDVIEAARRLAETRDDLVLVVAGGGAEEARLKDIVATDQRLARSVQLIGFQPRPIIAALRQASTVSLCPMGGFSLIEACAAATPVVAYDIEWHRELVIDGETGYLVPEGRATGLADAIARLLDDPEGAARMGANARKLAVERHDIDAAVATKRRFYDMLIDGRGEG